ncbi:MAG TPA: ATP-binding protein, partial [Draconibacterium sp.]|nr:ATP-binding protein [Draconibacterium sp.]
NPDKHLLAKQIFSDKNKLIQVMTNLFKNAVKFTESGTIEFGMYETENKFLNLYVKDTGIGIAENKKDIIFEFFRQGDDSHTRKFGGVGIGLAISKKIAEAMEGKIVVHSELGKGATFLFTVPFKNL